SRRCRRRLRSSRRRLGLIKEITPESIICALVKPAPAKSWDRGCCGTPLGLLLAVARPYPPPVQVSAARTNRRRCPTRPRPPASGQQAVSSPRSLHGLRLDRLPGDHILGRSGMGCQAPLQFLLLGFGHFWLSELGSNAIPDRLH